MIWRPALYENSAIGWSFLTERYHIFFGNKNGTLDKITRAFSNYNFLQVKQTHSNKVVLASPELVEADAHYTDKLRHALLIKTADCLPIFIVDDTFCCAIHAGWRGIRNEIVKASLIELKAKYPITSQASIFVGPHILPESFEVDLPLAEEFQKYYQTLGGKDLVLSNISTTKAHINLLLILNLQLAQFDISMDPEKLLLKNTRTDQDLASFRRTASATERNYSFVTRLR